MAQTYSKVPYFPHLKALIYQKKNKSYKKLTARLIIQNPL